MLCLLLRSVTSLISLLFVKETGKETGKTMIKPYKSLILQRGLIHLTICVFDACLLGMSRARVHSVVTVYMKGSTGS